MDGKQVTQLRGWIRRYGNPGILLAGMCLGLYYLRMRRRSVPVACIVLLIVAIGISVRSHSSALRHVNEFHVSVRPGRIYVDPNTALLRAVKHNDLGGVLAALRAGANVNIPDCTDTTALMFAVNRACDNIIRLLLERGADVNARNRKDRTAAMVAVEHK